MIMTGFRSMPIEFRPRLLAAYVVVPLPFQGSRMTAPRGSFALCSNSRTNISGKPA